MDQTNTVTSFTEQRSFTYTDDGLMLTMTDPRGMTNPTAHTYTFTYDEDGLGRLTEDADPAGGSKTLARTDADDGYTVTLSTGLGRTTTHQVQRFNTGIELRTITAPTGLQTVTEKRTDGGRTTSTPDGTATTLQEGPDPRFGMEAALPASLVPLPVGSNQVEQLNYLIERSSTVLLKGLNRCFFKVKMTSRERRL